MSDILEREVATTITEVEVYRKGCTIVSRGEAALTEGANRLLIRDLPADVDEGSISLRMPPVVTQGQVRLVRQDDEAAKARVSLTHELDQRIDELDRQIENKQLELGAWKDLATKMEGSAAIEYLAKLPTMLDQLTRELVELRTERKTLADDRDKQREQLMRPRLEVDVTVPEDASYPLELSYRSRLAGWSPSYDVLVGSLDEPLRLRLKGRVWQLTGDDWTDITLRLSTGTAAVMGDLPRFVPRYLRKWEPRVVPPPPKMARFGMAVPSMARSADSTAMPLAASAEETGGLAWDFDDVEELAAPEADVSEQATSTTYELVGPQLLAWGTRPQTIEIATTELPATYYHYAYPRREEAAYLVARLDAEPAPEVLEQPLAVYLEGSYAGSIRINRTQDAEGYELPLGRDSRVRVRRTEEQHRSKRLLGGKVTEEHTCTIMVENRKPEQINLVVLEQLPISQDKEIEVALREGSGATVDETRGELRWERAMETGARGTFVASYVISHAKGVSVDASERPTAYRSSSQRYCPRCGAPLSESAVFCITCGSAV